MPTYTWRALIALVLVATITVATTSLASSEADQRVPAKPPKAERVTRRSAPIPDPLDEARAVAAYQVRVIEIAVADLQTQIGVFVADADAAAIVAFVAAVREAERPRPAVVTGSRSLGPVSGTGGGGSCYDQSYVPAHIVSRESGGDPTVINGGAHAATPYESGGRAWGCFQFMPGTWNGSCADLGYDIASQIECANRVSNGGANLRPWSF